MDILNGFDEAVSKAKDALNVAYKKTEEVVNTQKQKFDITSLKNKREKDFSKLGEIYFNQIKNNESFENEAVKALVEAITEKNKKIEELEDEIISSRNKKICANCGANIDSNAIYCSACGQKVVFENE